MKIILMAWDLEITANSKYRAIATESCKLYIPKLVRINLLAKKFCGFCRKIYASKICIFMIDNKKKSETVLRRSFIIILLFLFQTLKGFEEIKRVN